MEYREFFSSCGIETDQIIIKDHQCVITINMENYEKNSFCEMVGRLNAFYDNPYRIEIESDSRATFYFEQKWLDNLTDAVSKGEHKFYQIMNDPAYDMKLGYSCNNNCIHCVIKPNIIRLQETNPEDIVLDSGFGMWCKCDLTYNQLLEQFDSDVFKRAKVVTLTGGEPTIRTDFIDVLKWLYYNRPDMRINLQTNGRALEDIELVKSMRRYCRDIRFLIAVHSIVEAVHNKVVNNRKESGNPYMETIKAIRNIKSVFPQVPYLIEIETVLSRENYMTLPDTIKGFHRDYGILFFKFSYPDMQDYEISKARTIVPGYELLGEVLADVNKYCMQNREINVLFEDIPPCVLNKYLGNEIYIVDTAQFMTDPGLLTINAVGSVNEDGRYCRQRVKYEHCKVCSRYGSCHGLWPEIAEINEPFISSIDKIF